MEAMDFSLFVRTGAVGSRLGKISMGLSYRRLLPDLSSDVVRQSIRTTERSHLYPVSALPKEAVNPFCYLFHIYFTGMLLHKVPLQTKLLRVYLDTPDPGCTDRIDGRDSVLRMPDERFRPTDYNPDASSQMLYCALLPILNGEV